MRIRFLGGVFLVLASIVEAKPLLIGIAEHDPPFAMSADKGRFFGFDIELMTSLCQQMKTECQFKPMQFNALFTELNKGTIQLAIAAITITHERQQQFLFSLPYLTSEGRFITIKNNPINTAKKLNKKKIGIIKGSIFKGLITQKIVQATVIEYLTTAKLISALTQKEVDSILLDDFSADYWIANNIELFKGIGEPIPVGIGYGIMAKKDAIGLINKVNNALKEIESNGIYLALYSKYFHTIPMH